MDVDVFYNPRIAYTRLDYCSDNLAVDSIYGEGYFFSDIFIRQCFIFA